MDPRPTTTCRPHADRRRRREVRRSSPLSCEWPFVLSSPPKKLREMASVGGSAKRVARAGVRAAINLPAPLLLANHMARAPPQGLALFGHSAKTETNCRSTATQPSPINTSQVALATGRRCHRRPQARFWTWCLFLLAILFYYFIFHSLFSRVCLAPATPSPQSNPSVRNSNSIVHDSIKQQHSLPALSPSAQCIGPCLA